MTKMTQFLGWSPTTMKANINKWIYFYASTTVKFC